MRVLIAEDDSISRFMLVKNLENWGYEAVVAEDGNQAWDILQQETRPPLAILDWMMPGFCGPELCKKVREEAFTPFLYIILLTALDEVDNKIEGLEAGADDYITKPFNIDELKSRIRAAERIITLNSDLLDKNHQINSLLEQTSKLNLELHKLAVTDGQTQLYNKRYFLDEIEREVARSQRYKFELSLILLDIDFFKKFNDTWGHQLGDYLLAELSKNLRYNSRRGDTVARFGGEEICALLPYTNLEGAKVVAEKYRKGIENLEIIHEGNKLNVTISLGISCLNSKINNAEHLIKASDEALYQAKREGRNRVCFYIEQQ